MNNILFISMYHYTRDLKNSKYPNIKGLDIELFSKQIDFLKNNFNIITMETLIDVIKNQKELPDKALLLTFDDGYIDNYEYALPILDKYNIQGSFFIPGKTFIEHKLLDVNKIHYTLAKANIDDLCEDLKSLMIQNNIDIDNLWKQYAIKSRYDDEKTIFVKRMLQMVLPEELRNKLSSILFAKYMDLTEEELANQLYMNKEQIQTMKNHGMYIGIHGYDHYWLGSLEKEKMQEDIDKALETMKDYIDPNCWVVNYPYGSYNKDVVEYVKSKGAVIGLTTKVDVVDINNNNPLELPRLDCNDFPPKSNNYLKYMENKND